MAEARFIKTVTFGGYDKAEVIRRLEYLNNQVYDMKNELRETKLIYEAYKKGTDAEKAAETVMAGERAKLTQLQVQNETLTTKLKATEDENKGLEKKVADLNEELEQLKEQLKAAGDKLKSLESGNDPAALSQVFIEAQKSADMLVNNAKAEAAKLNEDAKKAADLAIADANDEAAQIIFEAERTAAEKIADAKNKAEEMSVSSNNMKALMLDDVTRLGAQMSQLRTTLESFVDTGLADISDAEERLFSVSNTLREGGVPVFREPDVYEPEIPDAPKRGGLKDREDEAEERIKKKNELDKLKQMAEAIGGKKDKNVHENKNEQAVNEIKEEPKAAEEKKPEPAEAPAEQPKSEEPKEKKGGKIDLAALAAQASAISGKK